MIRYRVRVYPEDTLERTAEESNMEKCGEGRVVPDGGALAGELAREGVQVTALGHPELWEGVGGEDSGSLPCIYQA